MYRRILVPLDGSRLAEAALPAATAVAGGGEIRLLFVHEPLTDYEYIEYTSETDRAWVEKYLSEAALRLETTSKAPVSTAIRKGPVAREIMSEAEGPIDLIVMATHGRGVFSRYWLGSVADQCIRESRRPVLVIRPPESKAAEPPPFEVPRIVVPLDGSELAESILPHAYSFAERFEAPVALVQSVAYPVGLASSYLPVPDWSPDVAQARIDAAGRYLEEVADRMRAREVHPTVHVVTDQHPANAIVELAGYGGLVVIATHGQGGLGRALLGSVTDKVVRRAHGPVLVARPERKPAKRKRTKQEAPRRRGSTRAGPQSEASGTSSDEPAGGRGPGPA